MSIRRSVYYLISIIFLLGVQQSAAETVPLIDDPDIPKLAISIGHVEVGIRYKLEGEASLRETYTRTLDYKQTRTSTFDYDFTSKIERVRTSASNFDGSFKIGIGAESLLSFGGGAKIDNTTTTSTTSITHSRYESIISGVDQSVNVVHSEQFTKASFDADSGYMRVDFEVSNYGTKTVVLKQLDVAVISSLPFSNHEQVILSGIVGISSTTVPGAMPPGVPIEVKVPPTTATDTPYRFVVYYEKQPAAKIIELLSYNAIFRLQVNGVEFHVGSQEIPVYEKLAELVKNAITIRSIGITTDDTKYVRPNPGEVYSIRDVILTIDPLAHFGNGKDGEFLQSYLGSTGAFEYWGRDPQKRQRLKEFLSADLRDGAWTITLLRKTGVVSNVTFDTPMQLGDRLEIIYTSKGDIIRSAVTTELQVGIRTRDCTLTEQPAELPPICFKNVRVGDILRLEGKAWQSGFETVDVNFDKALEYFKAVYPTTDPTALADALTRGRLKVRQLTDRIRVAPPAQLAGGLSVQVGGLDPVPLQSWVSAGSASFESSVDGWFAANIVMPSTYTSSGSWVCIHDRPESQKLKLGRFLNMTPPEWNSQCPGNQCDLWHSNALTLQSHNPLKDRDVFHSRAYKLFSYHIRRVTTQAEYLRTVPRIREADLDRFAQASPRETPYTGAVHEYYCPAVAWPQMDALPR